MMIVIIRVIAACFLYSITRSNGEHAHLTDYDTMRKVWMKELEDGALLHESSIERPKQHTPLTGKLYNSAGEQNPSEEGVYVFAGEQTILGADTRPTESGAYVSTGEQIPIDSWVTNLGVGGVEQMPTSIGGYDCATHSLVNPCEKVNEYDILPLLPTCKQYVICQDRKLEHILRCADGRLFDHRVKKCLIEGMVDCPCQEKFSPSEAIDDGAKDQWNDIISSSGTKYQWITDKYDQPDKNKGSQPNALADSNKEIMQVASGITDTAAMANDNIEGNDYPTFYPTFYPSVSPDNTNSKSGKKPNKSAALKSKSSSSIDTATGMPTFVTADIYSPTMQSQATSEPSTTNSPNTGAPSIVYSPAIAPSALSDTDTPSTIYTSTLPTVAQTVSPVIVTNRPSYVMISKNPSTDEPTLTRISEIVQPSKRPTKAPTQQPNECVSESEIYNIVSDSIFPISPWTTTGDGNWTIYDDDTPTEAAAATATATKVWIQSPNLTGSTTTAIANASITTCETYLGGTMSITVLANVLPPTDVFNIYIDRIETVQLIE